MLRETHINLRIVGLPRQVQFGTLDCTCAFSSLGNKGKRGNDTGGAGLASGGSRGVSLTLHTTTSLNVKDAKAEQISSTPEGQPTLTTGVVPGSVVVVVVAVCAERRGEGVGRGEVVGRVVEWGGTDTIDWETTAVNCAEDLLLPPAAFFPPFGVTLISTSWDNTTTLLSLTPTHPQLPRSVRCQG